MNVVFVTIAVGSDTLPVSRRSAATAATDSATTNLSLKMTDIAFEALTETGRGRPAPYMARAKWVMFDDLASLDDAEVANWLKTSHELVVAKLTRKQRTELGLPA